MLVNVLPQSQVIDHGHTSKVRHVLHASAIVSLRALVPDLAQLPPIPTSEFDRVQELRGLEPSRTNKQIIVRLNNIRLPILANHTNTVRPNPMNRPRLKRHMRQSKSRIVIIRDNNPLATGVVFWSQFLPQIRAVGELRLRRRSFRGSPSFGRGGASGLGVGICRRRARRGLRGRLREG
jgi:hypothetical protein